MSGLKAISFKAGSFNSNSAPSWVSVDAVTGALSFTAPVSKVSKVFEFAVDVSIQDDPVVRKKPVQLSVLPCKVDNCVLWVVNNIEKCSKCKEEYELYEASSSLHMCMQSEASDGAKSVIYSTQALFALGLLIIIPAIILSSTSPQSIWLMVGQFQLLMLLPMTGAYMPDDIVQYWAGMDFTLVSMSFLSLSNIPGFAQFIDVFGFDQEDWYLRKIDIESGNTFVNLLPLVVTAVLLGMFHALVAVVHKLLIIRKCRDNFCKKFSTRLFNYLTFGAYVRLVLEAHQFILLSITTEIYRMETHSAQRIVSLVIAFVWLFGVAWFWGVVLFQYMKLIKQTPKNRYEVDSDDTKFNREFGNLKYLTDLYEGTRQTKMGRLNTFLQLLHRLLLIIWVVFVSNINLHATLAIFWGIQLAYTINQALLRPYVDRKTNVIDIINQVIFFILATTLNYFNTNDRWNIYIKWTFMSMILCNTLIIASICFGMHSLFSLFRWCINQTYTKDKSKMCEKAKNYSKTRD